MATTVCEFIWLKDLLDDLGCPCVTPMTLFVTMKLLCILQLIPRFMKGLNILK